MSALDALLAAGRAAAAELNREQITLHASADDGFDWGTGGTTPAAGTALYSGPARVKPVARLGKEVDAGERNVTLRQYVVSVPWSTPAPPQRVAPGAVIDVTSSPDGRLVGLRLWVTGVEYSSTATAWRISAEDRS